MRVLAWLTLAVFYFQMVSSTDRPIIGILAQEFDSNSTSSYIAASYVKAVEAAGARAVPIFLRQPFIYYKKLLYKLNGVVLPGGSAPLDTVGGYFETTARIYFIAKEMNRTGINFPVLGVCQGFEALAVVSNNMSASTLTKCRGMKGAMLPLEFKTGFRNSSLYRRASDEIVGILASKNVTPNYHDWCLRPTTKLKEPWRILSVNKDADGIEFISSMENGNFTGIQFHPEKCAYEWEQENPSFEEALLAARHFYDWLVFEARKNDNRFPVVEEEENSLIYNYSPEYSGKSGKNFEQMDVAIDPGKGLYGLLTAKGFRDTMTKYCENTKRLDGIALATCGRKAIVAPKIVGEAHTGTAAHVGLAESLWAPPDPVSPLSISSEPLSE